MQDLEGGDSPVTESKFFHFAALGMGTILLGLIGWIGINVAHIPVIDQEIQDLRALVQDVLGKQIDDHETRIRTLEAHERKH